MNSKRQVIINYYAADHPDIVFIKETNVYKLTFKTQLYIKSAKLLKPKAKDLTAKQHPNSLKEYNVQ